MISLLIKVDLIFLLNQFFDIIGFIVIKFIVLFVIKSTWGFINFIVLLFACASVCGRNTPPCQIVKGDDLSPVRHKTVVHTGNVVTDENSAKEKETDNSVSNSEGCAYTPVMVELRGVEPLTFWMPFKRATNCAITPSNKLQILKHFNVGIAACRRNSSKPMQFWDYAQSVGQSPRANALPTAL